MAIVLDSFNEVAADATTMTKSITVGNNANRILIVLVTSGVAPTANCASVTFNTSEALTLITGSNQDNGDAQAVQGWYLINPTATTANVVLDWNGTTSPDGNMSIWSLYGVDQSSPIGAVDELGDTTGDSPILNSITTTTDNSWILQVLGTGAGTVDPTRMVAASGQTKRNTGSGGSGAGDYDLFAGDLLVVSHGSTAVNITDSADAGDWSQQLVVEIKPAVATDLTVSVSDSISTSSITTLQVSDSQVIENETISISENTNTQVTIETNTSETIDTTESTNTTLVNLTSNSDNISINESTKITLESNVIETENITVSEALGFDSERFYSVSDTISVSEFNDFYILINEATSDSISVSEILSLQLVSTDLNITVSEEITVEESIELIALEILATLAILDSIGVSENKLIQLSAPNVVVNDSVGVGESIKVELNSDINVSEDISVSEQAIVELSIKIAVSETISISDIANQFTTPLYITKSEAITVQDTANTAKVHFITTSDSISVQDQVTDITPPHVPDYITPKLVMVEGKLAYLIIPSSIPHYVLLN